MLSELSDNYWIMLLFGVIILWIFWQKIIENGNRWEINLV